MRNDNVEPFTGAAAKQLVETSNAATSAGVIDQVRELLFGETQRSTAKDLAALDAKLEARLEALTATMNARFSEIETLVANVQSDAERAQAKAIDDIGAAISRLGADVRAMSGVRSTR